MNKKMNSKFFNLLLVVSMVLSTFVGIPFQALATENTDVNVEEKSNQEDLSLGSGYLGVETEAAVYDDFTNDIWLQYQQKALNVDDTVDLRPWRVEQVISNPIANDVARPNFHFEVISGDSVTLSEATSTEKTQVKAVKPGTSVVQVTYDALTYKDKTWGAISPVNTGYAVFVVGQDGQSKITLSDELMNWRHYDTIYYSEGETTPYSFTVNATDAESTRVLVNGNEIEGNNGEFTADLENRSNIISVEATDKEGHISSLHRVVDARFIEVNVENKTNPEEDFVVGDTAKVSFKGINLPVFKLATIYNPAPNAWGGKGSFVEYKNNKSEEFKGRSGQYDLATKNSFEVELKEAGDHTFTSPNGIFTSWWGSKLGSDLAASGPGEPNLNADMLEGYFSKMPDFTISVDEIGVQTEIKLAKNELELTVGDSELAEAVVKPENKAKRLVWSSSDKEVATVDKTGKISAVKPGKAVITASINKVKSELTVTVVEKGYKELVAHREATIKSLNSYKNLKDYRETQQDEIKAILKNAESSINKAGDKEAVDAIEKETKAKLDAVKTDKILTENETNGKTVTFSLEKFTIGQGFIIEPINVSYKKDENAAELFDRISKQQKLGYWNAGSLKKDFYLQGIEKADNGKVNIPSYISEKLNGPTTEEALATGKDDSDLGEFDYHIGAGWYYQVNNTAANVGMSNWKVKPNEVIRVQFTLVYGEDLTGTNFDGNGSKITVSNKDEALTTLANFNARDDKADLLKNATIKKSYDALYTKVQNTIIPQLEINQAVTDLNKSLEEEKIAKELQAHKDTSKKSLAEYKDLKDYRKAQQDEINTILKDANGKIDKAADKAGVDVIVKDTKAKLDAVKTDKELSTYIPDGRFVTITKKGYNVWSNFEWKKRDSSTNMLNQTFRATGKYNHANGSTYLSLHDNKGKWYGYINEDAVTVGDGQQGAYIEDGRYVTVTRSYNTWSNFDWKKRGSSASMLNQTFRATGKYKHFNGSTYLSLHDSKGKWYGYINEDAVTVGDNQQGAYLKDGHYVTVTRSYNTWSNFDWEKRGSGASMLNQTFKASGKYSHFNGSTYLSLHDSKGKWHGYINIDATKVADGQQGIYIKDNRKVTVNKKGYNTWTNFNWKKRSSTTNMMGKTFTVNGKYNHYNGETYYSLHDNKGNWHGYVNKNAVK